MTVPVDDTGTPLGWDPACSYWVARDDALSPPTLELLRHRAGCSRCMAYAEAVVRARRAHQLELA